MNAVIIGNSGHFGYALPAMKKYGISLDGIAVTDGENIDELKKSVSAYGFSPKIYSDIDRLFEGAEPTFAVINTIFNRNSDIASEALNRYINVFVEKPAALTFESLEKLEASYRKATRRRTPLLCGMYGIRYEAPFVTAKQLCSQGAIGKIRMVQSQKSYKLGIRPQFYSSRESYGGIICWVACHAVDWTEWITGEKYISVSAFHSSKENHGNGDMEVTSAMIFHMTGDVIAEITADMLRSNDAPSHGDDRMRISGTEGTLEIRRGKLYLNDTEYPCDSPQDIFEDMVLSLTENRESYLGADELFSTARAVLCARNSADCGGLNIMIEGEKRTF